MLPRLPSTLQDGVEHGRSIAPHAQSGAAGCRAASKSLRLALLAHEAQSVAASIHCPCSSAEYW